MSSVMILGGFLKHSLIDFPGLVSCVVFLSGCNFRCPYCHNPELVNPDGTSGSPLDLSWLKAFLSSRDGLLDGVVITGGEPTLQPDLALLCRTVKDAGLAVKLDTNGSRPGVVRSLLSQGLVDYVAMDIKTDPDDYPAAIVRTYDPKTIKETIRLIMALAPDYEFRTTVVPGLVDESAVAMIARCIAGANRYYLQRFNPGSVLRPDFFSADDRGTAALSMEVLKQTAAPYVQSCGVR